MRKGLGEAPAFFETQICERDPTPLREHRGTGSLGSSHPLSLTTVQDPAFDRALCSPARSPGPRAKLQKYA